MSERGIVARLGYAFRKDVSVKEAPVTKVVDPRHPAAHPLGGMTEDPVVMTAQRRVAIEMLKQIGANVLRGKDLLYVTFPAKCSESETVLQRLATSVSYSDEFLAKAAASTDPVERMGLVVAFYISGIHLTSGARKPLNPVLGETYEGRIGESTKVYIEQASHHPPITAFQVIGERYKYYGHLTYSAKFGVNELKLINKGERIIEFDDGTTIKFTTPNDLFSGVMVGTYRHQVVGGFRIEDLNSKMKCEVTFCEGRAKSNPSDYLIGPITEGAKGPSGMVEGSWLGFVDLNGRRLWSIEDSLQGKLKTSLPSDDPLPTDSRLRADVVALAAGDVPTAELGKRVIEEKQRRDRKLRAGKLEVGAKG